VRGAFVPWLPIFRVLLIEGASTITLILLVAVIKKETVSGQVLLGMVLILAASIVGKLLLDRSQKQV